MKERILGLCLILVGCVVDAEPTDDYGVDTGTYEEPQDPDWYGQNGADHDNGCHSEAFEMFNGDVMIIPGQCNPFYIYMGYPDPTEMDNPHMDEQLSKPETEN